MVRVMVYFAIPTPSARKVLLATSVNVLVEKDGEEMEPTVLVRKLRETDCS